MKLEGGKRGENGDDFPIFFLDRMFVVSASKGSHNELLYKYIS